jgi:DNA helicase-2/ATP-dependent DNA helicase PcrA
LLRALRRGGRGYAEETIESRFLEDIPTGLVSGQTRGGRRAAHRSTSQAWSLPSPGRPAPVVTQKFRAGMRVKHPVWEEGIVLDSRIQSDDEIVDVVFESVGIKRLAASLANLTILR